MAAMFKEGITKVLIYASEMSITHFRTFQIFV